MADQQPQPAIAPFENLLPYLEKILAQESAKGGEDGRMADIVIPCLRQAARESDTHWRGRNQKVYALKQAKLRRWAIEKFALLNWNDAWGDWNDDQIIYGIENLATKTNQSIEDLIFKFNRSRYGIIPVPNDNSSYARGQAYTRPVIRIGRVPVVGNRMRGSNRISVSDVADGTAYLEKGR